MFQLSTKSRARFSSASILALALSGALSGVAAAQAFRAAAGFGPVPANVAEGSDPQYIFSDDSGLPDHSRWSWAKAAQGFGTCSATSYHWSTATFGSGAKSEASFEFDDLIFSSTGTDNISVGLNLTVQGTSTTVLGKVLIGLQRGSVGLGTAELAPSGVTTTGHLTGYTMNGAFHFVHNMVVPVNTPVSLEIKMKTSADTAVYAAKSDGKYSVQLGGITSLVGGPQPVFVLPAGVTVNSAQAGIVNNLWSPNTDLQMSATPSTWTSSDLLRLTTWNGTPGQPAALFVTAFDGAPIPFLGVAYSTLNADGRYSLGNLPYVPAISGHSFSVTGATLHPSGAVELSDEEMVTVP